MTQTSEASLKGNILVVDDHPENLRILTTLLNQQGYKVRGVVNGPMALKAVLSTPPDLILLDIMMPQMDGYTVCRALKADERTSEIPVIFLSALDEVVDKVKAFQVGGVDYITKPFELQEVAARIETHLTIARQRQHISALLEQQKQSDAQLAQLAVIVQSSADAIISTSFDGQILSWNGGAERTYGYTEAEMVGQPIQLLSTESPQNAQLDPAQDPYTTVHRCKDGRLIDVFLTTSAVTDRHGQMLGLSWIARDISYRRELEKMKKEFVAIVSHELRTPLTSISGSLSSLKTGQFGSLSDKGMRLLQIAEQNATRLMQLVKDILDLERLRAGKLKPNPQPSDLASLMHSAQELVEPMSQSAGITLICQPVALSFWVDPDQLMQVLTNLLSNAIKFSPRGSSIWLTAHRQEDSILLQVKDQGRGIPTEMLDKIFDPFQQVDASDSRQKGGTGLGLAICRNIIQNHGGQIWAESILGQGSVFSLRLPLHRSRPDCGVY